MINNISWSNYWVTVIVGSAFYYLIICWKYFRPELVQIFTHPDKECATKAEFNKAAATLSSVREDDDDQMVTILQQAIDEVKACLEQLATNNASKEIILQSLQQIIYKYPSLKGSDYVQAFSQNIQLECYSTCAIRLSSEELREMWV